MTFMYIFKLYHCYIKYCKLCFHSIAQIFINRLTKNSKITRKKTKIKKFSYGYRFENNFIKLSK